ncbi:hypothetical protein PIB30_038115 [Stylosanthes scabra]|uniref:Uncharacterized protein n=1 Tax=Stylosanthes scabra TaxID=79078 RepID=A0ABU6SES1_9FABA|nr:hypothetical protein [Stylosanthes scabra]
MGTIPTSPWYYLYDSVHLPRSERISLRARGPGDSSIVPVTAGYSWEPGAESRTPSNTCSKCELNPEFLRTAFNQSQLQPTPIKNRLYLSLPE